MKRIIVPGYKGSPKGHWQHWLQENYDNSVTVIQDNWERPEMESWVARLQEVIESCSEPVQLVGHSMGCITILFWAQVYDTSKIDSALLVAPADSESLYLPKEIVGFSPIPQRGLPFPATLVGSHNDPYMSFERALFYANSWGADFVDAGHAGHINCESGYGQWDELPALLECAEKGKVLQVKTPLSQNVQHVLF